VKPVIIVLVNSQSQALPIR